MEMRNTLAPQQVPAAKNSNITYESNGEEVIINFDMVRRYLVSGGGNVSDEDIMMFISLCRFQHLNPFLREAYLIKYGNAQATIVTGKDVFLKRAQANPNFDGLEAGVIVQNIQTGDITERPGTFFFASDQGGTEILIGGWARVWLKNQKVPMYESVSLREYIGRKKSGEITEQWMKKPATMIRKVALVHALKEAFPEQLGALYALEEMETATAIKLDETPVQLPEQMPEENRLPDAQQGQLEPVSMTWDEYTPEPVPVSQNPADILFS